MTWLKDVRDRPSKFTTVEKINPTGSLQARYGAGGAITFFWRYSIGTSSERVAIGTYDPVAPPKALEPTERGYSFAAARRAAETLASEHHRHRGDGGRPALLAAREAAEKARQEAEAARLEAERLAATKTLGALLDAYIDHLQAMGRSAYSNARSIFKLHVKGAWPDKAAKPANQVTDEDIADMMRRLLEAGKGRTANKLRAYVRSAYQTARAAKSKPSIPASFKAFEVIHNPASNTLPDETQNRADKNPLTLDQMRLYWSIINDAAGFKGALLRLHLLTGGQRIEQLMRLRIEDIKGDRITIVDGKGRPGKPPRAHVVPLITDAAKALAELRLKVDPKKGPFALSSDGGVTHIAGTSLSRWAAEAVGDAIPGFQAKRIRSGVETALSEAGVSKDIRGRLLSHGIAGVQARNYDDSELLPQKREALELLLWLLNKAPE